MRQTQLLVFRISTLAVVIGLAACNSKAPEPQAAKMSNSDLDRAVTAKINNDAALVAYNLNVHADADKNAVTISGTVPTESLRTKAVEAAKTAGTDLVIIDKIDVQPANIDRKDYDEAMAREEHERATKASESIGDSLDDAWIHTKIRSKLLGQGEFPGGSLNVDVKNQVVTLRGTVATKADRTKAEEIAKATEGVKSVRNQLVIKLGS